MTTTRRVSGDAASGDAATTGRRLLQVSRQAIRWGDMDSYGHVNNTVYFRYMEQARCEWLENLGYRVAPRGHAPVIINASCTFLLPLTYPGTVEVSVFVDRLGNSSIDTSYELRLADRAGLYAEGASRIVWMDTASGRSVPLPAELRQALL